jgi:hypothetical protein
MNAVAPGDKAVWARVLADDCIVTDEDGGVYTKQAFLAQMHPLPAGFSGNIKVRDLSVLRFGDAAVVHYRLDEHESVFGQHLHTLYVETDTYRRLGASWQIVAMQTTVVPADLRPLTADRRSWPSLVGAYAWSAASKTRYRVFERRGLLYGGNTPASATQLIPLSRYVFFQRGSIHTMIFVPNSSGIVDQVVELHKYNEVVMRRTKR